MQVLIFVIVVICCVLLLLKIGTSTYSEPGPSKTTPSRVGGIVSKSVDSDAAFCALCKCKTNDLCKSCNTKLCYECAAELNNKKCPTCNANHVKVCKHDWVQIHNHLLQGYSPIKIEKYMSDYFPLGWKSHFAIKGDELELDGVAIRKKSGYPDVTDHICVKCGAKELKYTMKIVDIIKNKIEERRKKKLALEMIYKGKNES